MSRRQGTYWIGTIPSVRVDFAFDQFVLPNWIAYLKGQEEEGETGYRHFQIFFICKQKQSVVSVARLWLPVVGHWELTRSSAAEDYVWKEETRFGPPFEFGIRPVRRNSVTDWEEIRDKAKDGSLEEIPADIFVRYYRTLQAISADYCVAIPVERCCKVFWGRTGSGKSRRAWLEGGSDSYAKDPRSKFWCGYACQTVVIIDEFRGGIDISHLLRWLDRYPVNVEIKGSSKPLLAEKFFITSNIHPKEWYPGLDLASLDALIRRLEIFEMN